MTNSEFLVKKYCPNLYRLLRKRRYSKWNELDETITNQISIQKEIKTNLIRLLLEIEISNNPFAKSFAEHIDLLIIDILDTIPNKEKRIWESINGKITNIEDWNYLNPIGELSVLRKLLNSERFELVEIETQFPNGRKKDFLLKQKIDNKLKLIEVLNIHLPIGISVFEEIKKELLKKVQSKINREIEGVNDSSYLERLFILPVVWYLEMSDLECYYDFFKEFNLSLGKSYGISHQTLGFCTYVKTPNNQFIFGEASSIIDNFKKK